jgi:hypothetical protein
MDQQLFFEGNDLNLIESLKFDPNLEPSFDNMRDCLVWSDERPQGLTHVGFESLCDLLIARSFLHRGLDFSTYKLSPEYYRIIWDRALAQGFSWPGFQRLTLTEKDRAYFDKMLADNYEL